jgi:AcrR family transcriptional regulator
MSPRKHSGRTQQQRREEAEHAVLAAAAELLVAHGPQALTLAGVGERAGYSRGIVNHHFGSKDRLLEALADDVQRRMVPQTADSAPGLDRLLRFIAGYLESLEAMDVSQHAFLQMWAGALATPELTDGFRRRDRLFREQIALDVRAGIDAGAVDPDSDPASVAVAVIGQLRGVALQRLLDPDALDLPQLQRTVAAQWRRTLAAATTSHRHDDTGSEGGTPCP